VETLISLSLTDPIFVNLNSSLGGRAKSAFVEGEGKEDEEDSLELVPGEYSEDENEEVARPKTAAEKEAEKTDRDRIQDELDEEIRRAHEIPTNLTQHSMVVNDKRKLIDLIAFLRLKIASKYVMNK